MNGETVGSDYFPPMEITGTIKGVSIHDGNPRFHVERVADGITFFIDGEFEDDPLDDRDQPEILTTTTTTTTDTDTTTTTEDIWTSWLDDIQDDIQDDVVADEEL